MFTMKKTEWFRRFHPLERLSIYVVEIKRNYNTHWHECVV